MRVNKCMSNKRKKTRYKLNFNTSCKADKVSQCSSISLTCIGCGSWRWSPRSNKICGIHEGTSYGKAWTQLARPRTPAWRWIRAGDESKTWSKQSIELLLQEYNYTMKWASLSHAQYTQTDTVRNYNFTICSERKGQFSVRRRSESCISLGGFGI